MTIPITQTSPLHVAFQGVTGSFSSIAAKALCGPGIIPIHTTHFRDIFEEVQRGRAVLGVVPLENALAGSVHENYDLLGEYPLKIIGEYYCPVELHLLALPSEDGSVPDLSSLKQVLSHPKAFEQCSRFLEAQPHLRALNYSDTAGAAKTVRDGGLRDVAALAGDMAAEEFGLVAVRRRVQNHANNVTRFVAVARTESSLCLSYQPRAHKCSLLFKLPHTSGSLALLLSSLAASGANVTKIESRPLTGAPFEYVFHLDFELSSVPETLSQCVTDRILPYAVDLRVLGIYPAAHNG